MSNKSITKVSQAEAPHGPMGQRYLATGISMGLRLWEEEPAGAAKPETSRPYETVGYVLKGKAELHIEGQMVLLEAGDSWVVNKHQKHTYKILESFSAVEATHPPGHVHERDEP